MKILSSNHFLEMGEIMEHVQTYLFMLDLIFPVNKDTKIVELEPDLRVHTVEYRTEIPLPYHRFDLVPACDKDRIEHETIELEDRHNLYKGLYRVGYSPKANVVFYSKISSNETL